MGSTFKSFNFQDYGYGSNIQIFLFSRLWLWVQHSNILIFKIMLCVMAFECSLHGLVRGENMELGRDSDTGGQVGFSPCLGSSLIFLNLPGFRFL